MKTYEFPNQLFPIDKVKKIWTESIVENVYGNLVEDVTNEEELFVYKNFDVYENWESADDTDMIYMVNSNKLYLVVEENEEILKILDLIKGNVDVNNKQFLSFIE